VGIGADVKLGEARIVSGADRLTERHPAAASVGEGTALAVWQSGGDDNGNILGRFVGWPGEAHTQVLVEGRIAGDRSAGPREETLRLLVERVLEGAFPCATATLVVGPG